MDASCIFTFLSAKERIISSGDRAGQPYYRIYLLDDQDEPNGFAVDNALYARFKNECVFGDTILVSLTLRNGANGLYTRLSSFTKK